MDSTITTGRIGSSGRNLRRGEGHAMGDTLIASGRSSKSQLSVRVMESDMESDPRGRVAKKKRAPSPRPVFTAMLNVGKCAEGSPSCDELPSSGGDRFGVVWD